MDLRNYLQVFRRRWMLIAVCLILAVAAAALVTLRTTPLYTSTARLFISTPSTVEANSAYQGGLFSEQRVASYSNLITGENLSQRVIDKLELEESASQLSQQITSNVAPNTVILEVTVTDSSPSRAQEIGTAVAKEFTKFVDELESTPGQQQSPIKATIVDSADLPTAPASPQPLRNLTLAGILGLLLGLGLAVLRETLDTSVKSSDDVAAATGASMLGHIRYDPKAAKAPLITDLGSHAPRVEAFRMLRTNLQFVDPDHKRSKVFVVTSAMPEEGKSTTAINLALTLAQADQKVLLIEADLRRPKLGEYMHLEPTVGLTTVLIGNVGVDEAVQPWGADGLDILTSGATPPNPAELLQSHVMKGTLAQLRDEYDVIVIDAPPLLPVTDAALLAAQADGAIVVVRQGKTTKDQLGEATERLRSVDAKILGVVLNMTPERGGGKYGYGYGYGNGYAPQLPKKQRRQRKQKTPKKQEALMEEPITQKQPVEEPDEARSADTADESTAMEADRPTEQGRRKLRRKPDRVESRR